MNHILFPAMNTMYSINSMRHNECVWQNDMKWYVVWYLATYSELFLQYLFWLDHIFPCYEKVSYNREQTYQVSRISAWAEQSWICHPANIEIQTKARRKTVVLQREEEAKGNHIGRRSFSPTEIVKLVDLVALNW